MTPANELAWAAGLFDGEGSISCYRSKAGRGRISMSLGMTDEHPVRRFGAAIGGIITGPYQGKAGTKPFWQWRAGGFEGIQQSVCLLWKWLSQHKKDQVTRSFSLLRAWWNERTFTRKQFCKRGHDMSKTRRRKPCGDTYCTACSKERYQQGKAA